ncbi:MAG: methyltransferase type 11 [Flavobacteriaceae bacterium]|nr:MAG: methyltransferase type 11 [Flavobacteriaceae bacterium]
MEKGIQTSWNQNAQEWIDILASDKIGSRTYTNKAILSVLAALPGVKILDMGCGEGWLCRAITQINKKAVGIDGTVDLLAHAQKKGMEPYYNINYAAICEGTAIPEAPFDICTFNFSIYQKDGLIALLKKIKLSLNPKGQIVIQTLHPYFLIENSYSYESQWMEDAWKGLPGNFVNGHKWYARTFEDWATVFSRAKVSITQVKEVLNQQQKPISVIFILE